MQAWQPDDAGLVATCSKDGEVLLFDVEEIAHKGQPNLCLPVAGALSTDPTDEVTAFVWGLGGYFFVGHKSGILRGWHLPEEASEDDDGESEDNGSEDDAVDT